MIRKPYDAETLQQNYVDLGIELLGRTTREEQQGFLAAVLDNVSPNALRQVSQKVMNLARLVQTAHRANIARVKHPDFAGMRNSGYDPYVQAMYEIARSGDRGAIGPLKLAAERISQIVGLDPTITTDVARWNAGHDREMAILKTQVIDIDDRVRNEVDDALGRPQQQLPSPWGWNNPQSAETEKPAK